MKTLITTIAVVLVAAAAVVAATRPDRNESEVPTLQAVATPPVAASALATGTGSSADGRTAATVTVVGPDATGAACLVLTIVRANELGRQELRSVFAPATNTGIDFLMPDDGGGRPARRIVVAMPEGGWSAATGDLVVQVLDS